MQDVLEHVVSQGLGRKAGTPILKVAGKTGTSQVGEYDFREENNVNEYQLAFCGYFPADAPKYSIIVSMNKLGLPASGGGMAGVVFHDIVKWMISHGMPNLAIIDEMTNDTVRVTPNNVDSIISNSLKQD
jgi:cell division protein FtsI (penicillin-binding protein 3)